AALDRLAAFCETTDKPIGADWQDRDRHCVWHPYSALQGADEPLAVVAAEDEFLTLADGRRVIDGISSWWTILHCHREPAVMAAIREATHTLDRVFYSDNGSTAVEVALKMAYQFWCHRGESRRTLFVGFDLGYHGDTFGAMS